MPSLARFARHLRLFTMSDQDHPSLGLTHQRIKHHTAAAFPIRARPYQKNPIPLPPFLFLPQDITITANHKNNTFHCRPCPPSHKRRRIDIKAPKRANGIIPHQLPHLDYKTRNKAATIKKRGITEHQTSMHNPIHRYTHRCIEIQIPMHTNPSWHCDTFWFFVILDTDAYKNPDTDA